MAQSRQYALWGAPASRWWRLTTGCLAPADALVMRNPISALRLSTPPIGPTGFSRWAEMGFVGQCTLQAMPFPLRWQIDGKS